MFRIANPDTGRKVIQVAEKKGTMSYALLNTIPAYRADAPKDSEIRFRETAAGAPPAVGTYWYMGERNGYEFMYTKEQLAALNRSAQPAPTVAESTTANAEADAAAAAESVNVPPLSDTSKRDDVVDGAGVPDVNEPAEAEAQIAQAQPERPAVPAQPSSPAPQSETRAQLPQTASPLALLLLSGLATAGFGVKLLRKS